MIEIGLIGIIIALIGLMAWIDKNNRAERKSLLNAVLAKDNQELVNLELADKTEIKAPREPVQDVVETSALSDDEYINFITGKDGGK